MVPHNFYPNLYRAQKNDQTMAEMEPADTFTLTLRPYQKQALKYDIQVRKLGSAYNDF